MVQQSYINDHPLIKPNKVEARLYQQTLFASCVNKNSLVILPTGLGKTIVFIMIAAHHLNKDPNAKIILCAPTKPLLDQHETTIKDTLNIDESAIYQVSGQIRPSQRSEIWQDGQLFICTPQTLQNDIIQRRVNLENVRLLCLDEVHKAVGDHSYVFVAEQYLKQSKKPLILGITASPGSNPEKIREIQENIRANNIEMRDETSDDVKQYIHDIDEEWRIIPLTDDFKTIIDTLNSIFKEILQGLKELNIIQSSSPRNNPRRDLLKLRSKVNEIYGKIDDSKPEKRSEFFTAMSLVGNSIRVSHAIELIETQGIPSLNKYLDGIVNDVRMGKGSGALKSLVYREEFHQILEAVKILQKKQIIHPKIDELKTIISNEVSKNPSNRILIFAHFRVTAKTISDEIMNLNGVRPHWFVGQSSMKDDKGLSQKQQIEIMKQFRSGEYNILVSTSVAEEGLDIGQCELVIFYDAVPSAIRLIQRKGRTGRRKEGKVIMLIAKGTRDEGYMWASKRQAKKMRRIVHDFKTANNKKKNSQKEILDFIKEEKKDKSKKSVASYEKPKQEIAIKKEIKSRDSKIEEIEQVIKVICDSRERNSTIVKELVSKGTKIGFERLDIGDYICSDQVVVERKETDDLIQSIIDKRLFKQAQMLTESCAKPLIILEGDINLFRSSLHPNALAGAISSLTIDYRIPIIYTKNQKETATILYTIAKREQEERKRRISITKSKAFGLKAQITETVSTLPHIDYRIATRLLKHFKSIRNIMNAKLEEYMEVKGIGEKIAHDIIEFTYTQYDELEEKTAEDTLEDLEWLKKQKKKKE